MAAITWTGGTFNSAAGVWSGVVWAGDLNLFIAVNGGGGSGTDRIETSPDGSTWTSRTTPNQATTGLYWSDDADLAVVVGDDAIMTSSDGVTWTSRTAPGSSNSWYAVTYAPSLGLWAATRGGAASTGAIMTSANGTTGWTIQTTPSVGNVFSIAWSPTLSMFAAPVSGSNTVITSSNGTAWTSRTIGTNNASWTQIEWDATNARFIAFGGTHYSTSTNGTAWTEVAFSEGGDNGTTSIFVPDQNELVIVTSESTGPTTSYAQSADVTTWPTPTQVSGAPGTADFLSAGGIAYSPTLAKIVVTSQNSTYDFLVGAYAAQTSGWFSPERTSYDEAWTNITSGKPAGIRTPSKLGSFWTNYGGRMIGAPAPTTRLTNGTTYAYAGNNYTLGSGDPPVRLYDVVTGQDTQLARVPTLAGAHSNGILSMNTYLNDQIVVGTYDAGSSYTDFQGRLIRFAPNGEATVSPTVVGYLPYVVLTGADVYVGMNRGTSSQAGRIYRSPYGDPTNFLLDFDLSTLSGIGGATCGLGLTYGGYVCFMGTDAASGTAAILGARSGLGAWAAADTGLGTGAGNGFLAMSQFSNYSDGANYLVTAYYNPGGTHAIRRSESNNALSWSTVHTETDPIVGLATVPIDGLPGRYKLLAWTGGTGVTAKLLISDGDLSVWTDITADLPVSPTTSGFLGIMGRYL